MKQRGTTVFFLLLIIGTYLFPAPNSSAEGPFSVSYENDKLSVAAEDRTFGEILNAIAHTVHFSVRIPPELSAKRISIRMKDTDLDRSIARLFSLVQEKNFSVKYTPVGTIEHIQVIRLKEVTAVNEPERAGAGGIPPDGLRRKRIDRTSPRRVIPPRTRRFQPRYRTPRRIENLPPGLNAEIEEAEDGPEAGQGAEYDDGTDE